MDLKILKEIIYNVNHLCSHIEHSRDGIRKINFDEHEQVYIDVHRLLDIFICSLLDELKIFEKFAKNQNNDYILDTVYALTPLVNYIKKFDSLRVKRNKVLAHHNRNRNQEFKPWWKELQGKRFATTDGEQSMIFSTIRCIHDIFKRRFPKELDEILKEFDKEIDIYESKMMEVPDVDSFKDIKPTIIETQKRMRERDFSFIIMSKK